MSELENFLDRQELPEIDIKDGEDLAENEDEFMFQIYIGLGIVLLAFILLILIYFIKKKFCPDKNKEEKDEEISDQTGAIFNNSSMEL